MRHMVLVLDESGEKQYSDKPESKLGDVGVMSGVFLTERGMAELSSICRKIFSSYYNGGKRHITDINDIQKEKLRHEVVKLFKYCGIRWFYEAIYSQGFHENMHDETRLGYKTYEADRKQLLHAKLFRGMFNKSLDVLSWGGSEAAHIRVVTDRVDKSIIKKFKSEAEDALDIWLGRERSEVVTYYDRDSDKVSRMKVKSSVNIEEIVRFDKLTYEINCEDSDLTFLADILANMTRHYLLEKQKTSLGIELNSKESISEHPLKELVVTAGPEGQFTDKLYRRNKT